MIYILTAKEINVMALRKTARITEVDQTALRAKFLITFLPIFIWRQGSPSYLSGFYQDSLWSLHR